jgi:hypothetical protein
LSFTNFFLTLLFQFLFEIFKWFQYDVKCLSHIRACWYKKTLKSAKIKELGHGVFILLYIVLVVYLIFIIYVYMYRCIDETSYDKEYMSLFAEVCKLFTYSTSTNVAAMQQSRSSLKTKCAHYIYFANHSYSKVIFYFNNYWKIVPHVF